MLLVLELQSVGFEDYQLQLADFLGWKSRTCLSSPCTLQMLNDGNWILRVMWGHAMNKFQMTGRIKGLIWSYRVFVIEFSVMELNKDNEPEQCKPARPTHPLPDEILKMSRTETVCQYCGVSYLIHNEIKVLEDRLKVAELELEKYHGLEKREEELNQQLQLTTSSLSVTEKR